MSNYREQVQNVIQAAVIHSPTSFSWFGKRFPKIPLTIRRALTIETTRNYLLFNLQLRLYSDFYCPGFAAPTQWDSAEFPATGPTPFVQALSAVNSGKGYWEQGWAVGAIENDRLVIRRGGLELWGTPEDCLVTGSDAVTPGTVLSLGFPKESLSVSPGFYVALSDNDFPANSTPLVRLYLNVTAEGALSFLQSATLLMNRAGLPFKLKVLKDPAHFVRCDSAVLYIRKEDYQLACGVVGEIYARIAVDLKPGTPAFTKVLAAGVGMAEDPGQGSSFGMHRCRLLADGLFFAFEQGKNSVDERLEAVIARIAEQGISLEKPFLNPGSSDDYDLPIEFSRPLKSACSERQLSSSTPNAGVFLETAHEIARHLSRQAVWHEDCCSWMGAEPADQRSSFYGPRAIYKALGPDLYSGTAGIALFLSALCTATHDAVLRRTALGAIRHALSQVDVVLPSARLSLYAGWVGIALAAAYAAIVFDDEELLLRASKIVHRAARGRRRKQHFDLISGSAGAIAGLIVLEGILKDTQLLDLAVWLGDSLLNTADRSEAGWSWKSTTFAYRRNLTGLSHGAAGIAYALLELFCITREPKYKQASELAFNYERYWYDAGARNWPDFREETSPSGRTRRAASFASFWCHGAPGIALSRLRAYHILKDEMYRSEAEAALQTTHRMVEATLSPATDFSLCHGLAGNADILLYGSQELGHDWSPSSALAREVAAIGMNTYPQRFSRPFGTIGSQTPGLMLGWAGVGYFYLRMHTAVKTPSVLLLRSEDFAVEEITRYSQQD